jgi:sodium-dependent dicarboxylate transporter 2/3/5
MMEMMKTGFLLNIIAIILITILTIFWGTAVLPIDLFEYPEWALEGAKSAIH